MRGKKKRLYQSNRKGLRLMTVAVLVLFSVLTFKTVSLQQQAEEYQATLDKYQEDMAQLEQDKEDIKEMKEYVQSDEYIEEMAREKLGLVYENEVIFEADEEQ